MRPASRWCALVVVMSVLCLAACSGGAKAAATKRPRPTTTSSTSTTTTSTVPEVLPVAPLTGAVVPPEAAGLLGRPALAIKVDNAPEALPHAGVNHADVVFEIQVEGVSRLMAVFHSADAPQVGPTRSARYSDPPILAMFGRPLFGWSGANEGVTTAVMKAPWIVNVNWDSVAKNEYRRVKGRRAPHNLFTDTASLFRHARPDSQAPPAPIFTYLGPGETNPTIAPVAGLNVRVGTTPSTWVWDPDLNGYRRWQYGRVHATDAGQATATNVVVLLTQYTKGPFAVTTGSGPALVLQGGGAVTGTWSRGDQASPYTLTATDGSPIRLNPGRTWVELANHPWAPISPEQASGLLATAR